MYLYFLTVAGILLFVFSLQYILHHNYYITLLLSGRNLSVKTTALSWSFQTLLLDPAGVCVWPIFYELCLLMVTFSGSNIWVTSQDSNFFLASWPQKGILAFPSLEDCQCWPLGQRLALMLRPYWFLLALLSGFDERLFTLPYSMGKKRNAWSGGVTGRLCPKNQRLFSDLFFSLNFSFTPVLNYCSNL